jgi:hypothetical protein
MEAICFSEINISIYMKVIWLLLSSPMAERNNVSYIYIYMYTRIYNLPLHRTLAAEVTLGE